MDIRIDQRRGCARRRSEEHTSELQSQSNLVCRLLLEKKNDRLTLILEELIESEHTFSPRPDPAQEIVGTPKDNALPLHVRHEAAPLAPEHLPQGELPN